MFIRRLQRGNLLSLTRPQLTLCHHFHFLCFLFCFPDEKGQKRKGKAKDRENPFKFSFSRIKAFTTSLEMSLRVL